MESSLKRSSSARVSARPSSTLPRTSLDSSSSGSCSSSPTVAPGASMASPVNSLSTPAMIRSRLDLPAPLGPSTPILAPGRKASVTSLRTCLSGGCTRLSRCIVKTYWVDMRPLTLAPAEQHPPDGAAQALARRDPRRAEGRLLLLADRALGGQRAVDEVRGHRVVDARAVVEVRRGVAVAVHHQQARVAQRLRHRLPVGERRGGVEGRVDDE